MPFKSKGLGKSILLLAAAGVVFYGASEDLGIDTSAIFPPAPVEPDWDAISAWPGVDAEVVDASPDPNRRITAIVLDDSGSMSVDMEPAKQAVIAAVGAMQPQDRVGVIALNRGVVLPFSDVTDAQSALPAALRPVRADGSTPLGAAMGYAREMLAAEAARARSFGTYRMIITTDGQADSSEYLTRQMEDLAARTPIQIATIGIGISGGHVLRRNDLGSFVDVSNVDALRAALEEAIAENADFAAITDFGLGN